MAGTVVEVAASGVQFFTRPSASVVARKLTGLVWPVDAPDRRVNVTGRFAAGVPVSVFRTWQVIGSRDIGDEDVGVEDTFVGVEDDDDDELEVERSWFW